jgi:hypothetical protein
MEGLSSQSAIHVLYSTRKNQYTSVVDFSEGKEVKAKALHLGELSLAQLMVDSPPAISRRIVSGCCVFRWKVFGDLSIAVLDMKSSIRHHHAIQIMIDAPPFRPCCRTHQIHTCVERNNGPGFLSMGPLKASSFLSGAWALLWISVTLQVVTEEISTLNSGQLSNKSRISQLCSSPFFV